MSNSKAIGVAYSDQDIIGADFVHSANELGFTAAATGAVTQATNKSTGVTLNLSAGVITMNNASLASATNVSFTLTNSKIAAGDVVVVSLANSGANPVYNVWVSTTAAGSAVITVRNISGGSLSEAIVINFAVIQTGA